MTLEEEIALTANVKSITDRLVIVDQVFAAARIGVDMVMVFQCGESGLFFPGNYVREWGREWGDGLGPHPVSETLQSSYDISPPMVEKWITSIEQIMHPVRNCFAQVDMILVEASVAAANMAIPMKGDERMQKRAPILYQKQLVNPASRIARLRGLSLSEMDWELKRNGGFR